MLSANVTEAVIRPIASLPDDGDLQSACWQLAESFAPERGPTTRLVGRLVSVVRECLEAPLDPDDEPDPDDGVSRREGIYRGPRPAGREIAFCRPVQRLAHWTGFNPAIVIAEVDDRERAKALHRSCGILAERCRLVQERLAATYPELSHA